MFTHDLSAGAIADGGIRYLMMRPDVLMGAAKELPREQAIAFLDALERSAFLHSRDSFARYKSSGRFGADDFLTRSGGVAASLGWGVWQVSRAATGDHLIEVHNSPFAFGHGPSAYPVCAAINGVLRAIALTGYGYGETALVKELECAAQSGGPVCRFRIFAG